MLLSPVNAKTLILADQNGTPRFVVEDGEGKLRSSLGRYQVLSSMPDLLVLRREASAEDSPPGRVLMAGEIVSDSTIVDIVNFIVSSRWTGTLHVQGLDCHRTFGFDSAALLYATSDHPEDRLDKVMFRHGALTPAQSEAVFREHKLGQRFGEILIERGLIERGELFEHLQRQMEEIFFAAALERRGAYVFRVFDEEVPPPSLIAHLPAHPLLLSAAERLDQVKEFRQLIPDEEMCPELIPEVELSKLRPRTRSVLSCCDGQKTVTEIAAETWLGRFHTLRILHRFLLQGQIRLLPRTRTLDETAEGLAAPFSDALKEVFGAVAQNGALSRLHRELQDKIDESEHRDQLRRVLDDQGSVDAGGISQWLTSLEVRDRAELVGHALHELASFALFNASLTLPRAEERQLAERVQQYLARLSAQR